MVRTIQRFYVVLGNEVSEANGDAHSLKTIKRLLERVKEVDDSRFVTMGMDQFRFGDGSGGHEKIANLLDVVGLNYSEDNIDGIRKRHPKWRLYGSDPHSLADFYLLSKKPSPSSPKELDHCHSLTVQNSARGDYPQPIP